MFLKVISYRVRLVSGTAQNRQEQGLLTYVWWGLRLNRTELGRTQLEHGCSTKILGTPWNKLFFTKIPPLSFFLSLSHFFHSLPCTLLQHRGPPSFLQHPELQIENSNSMQIRSCKSIQLQVNLFSYINRFLLLKSMTPSEIHLKSMSLLWNRTDYLCVKTNSCVESISDLCQESISDFWKLILLKSISFWFVSISFCLLLVYEDGNLWVEKLEGWWKS